MQFFSKPFGIVAGMIFSGLCWYFSCGLNGDYWWLLWIAPIPVILITLNLSPGKAFLISFLSYIIGRLSWVAYLLSVLPVLPTIVFTLLFPLIFAFNLLITRKVILKSGHWTSIFAFPVCTVAFEYLFFLVSRDGTFGSLAYTQSNFLPLIQLASVTGITGISFMVCLFPSAVAVGIYYWNDRKIRIPSISITIILLVATLIFGIARIKNSQSKKEFTAGLTIIEKKLHFGKDNSKTENAAHIISLYEPGISQLAHHGAEVVVLPEKIVTITNVNADTLVQMWKDIAVNNHVTLVIGYTSVNDQAKTNNALVISSQGKILSDYQKVNLFEGEVYEGFSRGVQAGLFNFENVPAGVAVCKDMDFQNYMRSYGRRAKLLFVPAWDFKKDDWLHARMAILRGVENGYGIIRNAMEGKLTISDDRGRVLYETSCSNEQPASLLGKLPIRDDETVYSRLGDWFGIACMLATLYFIGLIVLMKSNRRKNH